MKSLASQRTFLLSACMAVILLGAQAAVVRWSASDVPVRVLLPLTIALAPCALWPYRARLGVWVIFVGLMANLAAILANGGLMPIERATVVDAIGAERAAAYRPGSWIQGSKDVLVGEDGRLVALGDSIIVRTGGGGGFAASPGDVVIWAGLIILAAEASLAWQQRGKGVRSEPGEAPRGAAGSAPTMR
jgi:hypothetical protein